MARSKLTLDRYLPYRLSILANTVSSALAERYRERFGLTISQWRVMAILGPGVRLSAHEICEQTAMDKVTVSRAVAGLLEARRLIRSHDPEDGRRAILRLSARGRGIYRRIVPVAHAYEAQLVSRLSERDLATLDRLLMRLTDRARELRPDP